MARSVCIPFRLLPGKGTATRAFMEELERDRFDDYTQSQARIGATLEHWFIGEIEGVEYLIGFIHYGDFDAAVQIFAASQHPFDRWFKARCLECTGVDFNNPPAMTLPVLVSKFPR